MALLNFLPNQAKAFAKYVGVIPNKKTLWHIRQEKG